MGDIKNVFNMPYILLGFGAVIMGKIIAAAAAKFLNFSA